MSQFILALIAVLASMSMAQDVRDTTVKAEPYADTVMLLGSIEVQPEELPTLIKAKATLAKADQVMAALNSYALEPLSDYSMAYYDVEKGEWYKTTRSASLPQNEKTATAMLDD